MSLKSQKDWRSEKLFLEKMANFFSKFDENNTSTDPRSSKNPKYKETLRTTPSCIIIKLKKTSEKGKNFKSKEEDIFYTEVQR